MKTSSLPLAAAVLALSLVSSANAADVKFINIATASTSGSYYPAGLAISKLINDNLGVRASAQSSAGSVENVSLLRNGEANMAIIQNNVVRDAMGGKGTFEGKAYKDMAVLCPLFTNTDHVVIRVDSGISSLKDIKGKKWAIGAPGSGTLLSNEAILSGANLTTKDVKAEHIGQTEALAALQNGIIDGADVISGVPYSQLDQARMSSGGRLALYSMTPEEQKAVVENSGWKAPFKIPANTYRDQPEPVLTVSHLALIMVPSDLPEQLAHDILKLLHDKTGDLRKAHGAFSTFDVSAAPEQLEALKLPIHPGAKRFYDSM
ncbi:MAG: TAXI family TRAP transporter solute-binding subunit [Rhodospirillales bacterium]|jgi:TRAP transporter TAXI family solute receptor|nr:TAXI family TRAP transporter solute-binding subunit [Rhodospirillales bacterium]